jgi:hypothetical protein
MIRKGQTVEHAGDPEHGLGTVVDKVGDMLQVAWSGGRGMAFSGWHTQDELVAHKPEE